MKEIITLTRQLGADVLERTILVEGDSLQHEYKILVRGMAKAQENKTSKRMKKKQDRDRAIKVLTELGIDFTTGNDGVHCLIYQDGFIIDFWAGTGRWIVRGSTDSRGYSLSTMLVWMGYKAVK